MGRTLLPGVVAVCLTLFAASTASAQLAASAHGEDVHASGRHGICGTFLMNNGRENLALANTAARNPELYRRIVGSSKRQGPRMASVAASDFINAFLIRNDVTNQFDEIQAKLVFNGRRARIWVDVRDSSFVKAATIATLAKGLDSTTSSTSRNPAKGIIDNDEEVFGAPPPNRFDSETPNVEDFLLTDIPNSISGGDILGFFSPLDQTDNPGSNKMNILYIDTRPGLGNQGKTALDGVLSTLAHEYQHLIHYNLNKESEIFFNEGCSELASTLCGYFDRQNTGFLTNTNVPLLRWVHDDPLDDYERALTYMRYMFEQLGEPFVTQLVKTQDEEMVRVGAALATVGHRAEEWQDLLKGFGVANYLMRNFSDPRYIYQRGLSNSTARVHNSYPNQVPATGSLQVEQYGTFYNLYSFTTPAGIKVKFDGGRPFAVMVVLFRGGQAVEVQELTPGTEYTLGEAVGYSKIVFAVVNLDYSAQTIRWTASQVTSGVDAAEDAAGALSLADPAPNPTRGDAAITYRVPRTAPVTVSLFDEVGRRVRNIESTAPVEPGVHTMMLGTDGLPAGAYIIRVAQADRSVYRTLIVAR